MQDPLIPDEMYADCVQAAAKFKDAQGAAAAMNMTMSGSIGGSGGTGVNESGALAMTDPLDPPHSASTIKTHHSNSSLTSVDREKERLALESLHEEKEQEVAAIISRLPTINRRVILFVISFLQLFLDEKVIKMTKMTSANIALVMAPNLLRCRSESMRVVFTNAQ